MSGYQAIEFEQRRIAYEQQETRRDRTPGTFKVWRSPFASPEQICQALTRRDGVEWTVWQAQHVGGQTGSWTFATKSDEGGAITLTSDSQGRWWIALQDRRWGMLDIDATERLADFDTFASTCDEQSAGARADEEMAQDMRHPMW